MTDQPPRPFLCGLDAALRLIGAKWKPLILHFLYQEPKRYGELKRCIAGVTDKVLIQQFKDLETHGVVSRTDHKEIPPRADYALTDFGRGLADALKPLCEWGEVTPFQDERHAAGRGCVVGASQAPSPT